MKIISKGIPYGACHQNTDKGTYECLDCGSIIYFERHDKKVCPVCNSAEVWRRYDLDDVDEEPNIKNSLIKEIMGSFDFEKVHEVMKFLNWKWASLSNEGIPTVDQLRDEARKLLKEAWDKKSTISTGGFTARYHSEEDDGSEYGAIETLDLSFNIDQWDASWSHAKNKIEYF